MRCIVAVAVASLTALATWTIPAWAGSGSGTVLVSKCGAPGAQRPKEIIFYCGDTGLLVRSLRWSSWGGRVAVGTGVQWEKVCVPNCATGGVRTSAVVVHLYKRRHCPGRSHLHYRDATVIAADGRSSAQRIFCPD